MGYDIENDDVTEIFGRFKDLEIDEFSDIESLYNSAVNILISGGVIGWAQDRAEFGPRALGNRSILADPSKKEAQLYVNKSVKFREPFRPFAPAILEEELDNYFYTDELNAKIYENHPLYFMLMILKAKPLAHEKLPACIHVDGTSRVQIVSKKTNPKFYF